MTEKQAKRIKRKKKRRMRKILSWSIVISTLLVIIFGAALVISIISKNAGGGKDDAIRLPVVSADADASSGSIVDADAAGTTGQPDQESESESEGTSSDESSITTEAVSSTTENNAYSAESTADTTTVETTTENVASEQNATTASDVTETATSQAATLPSNVSGSQLNAADFANYSTEKVPYGFGAEVDADNRPDGCTWYSNKFSNYTALFIMPKSSNIYLTFDEGYEYGFSGEILDVLKEKNVKCVFFITLPYAKENPDLVQRMIDEGHVVGNHSVTHPAAGLSTLSIEQQINEVKEVNDYVLEHFDYQMYLFRFPTGAFSEQSLAIVQSQGYRSVFWSFAYKDWVVDEQPDVAASLENALNKVHGGAIYLLHAESTTNAQMLADFIDGCRKKGYEFGYYSKVD